MLTLHDKANNKYYFKVNHNSLRCSNKKKKLDTSSKVKKLDFEIRGLDFSMFSAVNKIIGIETLRGTICIEENQLSNQFTNTKKSPLLKLSHTTQFT